MIAVEHAFRPGRATYFAIGPCFAERTGTEASFG